MAESSHPERAGGVDVLGRPRERTDSASSDVSGVKFIGTVGNGRPGPGAATQGAGAPRKPSVSFGQSSLRELQARIGPARAPSRSQLSAAELSRSLRRRKVTRSKSMRRASSTLDIGQLRGIRTLHDLDKALVKAEAALVAEALQTGRRRSSTAVINEKNCCNPIVRTRYKNRCKRCCRRTFCSCREQGDGAARTTTPSARSVGGSSSRSAGGSARNKVLNKLGENTELGEKQKIAQAALFVRDAAAERPVRIRTTSKCSTAMYRAYYNSWVRAFVVMVVITHLMLVLFEPNAKDGATYHGSFSRSHVGQVPTTYTRSVDYLNVMRVEAGCLLVYVLDCIAKIAAIGMANFFMCDTYRQPWDHFRVLVILTLVADWVFAYYVQWDLRPFRFLRPLVFISYVRELRRWMYLSVRMLPKLFEMSAMILVIIAVFAVIGELLFVDTDLYADREVENFDDLGSSMLSLFVLYTSENYPDVMYPASHSSSASSSLWYTWYFVFFVLVGMFCLANLVVPILYKDFRELRKQLALQVHLDERRSLLAAFHLLDWDATGIVPFDRFDRLVRAVRHIKDEQDFTLPRLMMKEMHEMAAAQDGSLGNDPLAKADAMQGSMRFKTRRPSLSTGADPASERTSRRRKSSTPAGVTSRARRVSVSEGAKNTRRDRGLRNGNPHSIPEESRGSMSSAAGDAADDVLNVYQFFFVCEVINRRYRKYTHHDLIKPLSRRVLDHPGTKAAFLAMPLTATLVMSFYPVAKQFVDIYCLVSIGLGLAEHIGRFIAVRWRIYKRSRATLFDLFLVVLAGCLYALKLFDIAAGIAHIDQLWLMILCLRTLRVLSIVTRFRTTLLTVVAIGRFMCIIFTVILLLMFSFAVVGMELFAGTVTEALTCSDTAVVSTGSRLLVASVDGNVVLLPGPSGGHAWAPPPQQYVRDVGWKPAHEEVASDHVGAPEPPAPGHTASPAGAWAAAAPGPGASPPAVGTSSPDGEAGHGSFTTEAEPPRARRGGGGGGGKGEGRAAALQVEIASMRRRLADLEAEMATISISTAPPHGDGGPALRGGRRGPDRTARHEAGASATQEPEEVAAGPPRRHRAPARLPRVTAHRPRRRRTAVSDGGAGTNATSTLCSELPGFVDTNMSFDTFLDAMLVLFQMVTTSNWHEVMYTAMWATDSALSTTLYFVAFYFFTVTFMLNLVLAIYIDSYETAEDQARAQEQVRLIQEDMTPESRKAAQIMGQQAQFYKIKGARRMTTLSTYLSSKPEAKPRPRSQTTADASFVVENPYAQAQAQTNGGGAFGRQRSGTTGTRGRLGPASAFKGRRRGTSVGGRVQSDSSGDRTVRFPGSAATRALPAPAPIVEEGPGDVSSRDLAKSTGSSRALDKPSSGGGGAGIGNASRTSSTGRGRGRGGGGAGGLARRGGRSTRSMRHHSKRNLQIDVSRPSGTPLPSPSPQTPRTPRSSPGSQRGLGKRNGARSASPALAASGTSMRPLSAGGSRSQVTAGRVAGSSRRLTGTPSPSSSPPPDPGTGSRRQLRPRSAALTRGASTRHADGRAVTLSPIAQSSPTMGSSRRFFRGAAGESSRTGLLSNGGTGKQRRGSRAPSSPAPASAVAVVASAPWDGVEGVVEGDGDDAFLTTDDVATDGSGNEWTVCYDAQGNRYYYSPELDESRWQL